MFNANVTMDSVADAQGELTLLDTESPGYTLAGIIIVYGVLWMLVTLLLSPVVPYDAVEAWHWGQSLEAGSPKNPWLVGAVAALSRILPVSWPTYWYVSHFLAMMVGAWGCWRLCQRLIPDPRQAMLAVLMLSLTASTSIDLMPYNDNYLLMMLWPWVWVGFIRAVYDDGRYWLFLGIVMALGGMAKYTTVLFLPFMAAIMMIQGRLRQSLVQPWLWLGLLAGVAIIAPNLWWLAHHQFSAFRWFSDRVGGHSVWATSRVYLAVFYNVPLMIVLLLLARWRWRWRWPFYPETQAFVLLAVVPVVLMWGYFTFRGGMRTEWMMPFAMPVGLATIMCMTPGKQGHFRLPLYACYAMAALALCSFTATKAWESMYSTRARHHVPALAVALNDWWHQHYQQPLVYAGGSRMGDWMGVYAPDHPLAPTRWPTVEVQAATPEGKSPFPNVFTPGLTEQDLQDNGAMWVGEAGSVCSDSDALELDPSLGSPLRKRIQYHTFVFRQDVMPQAVFSICVGILPPGRTSIQASVSDASMHDSVIAD